MKIFNFLFFLLLASCGVFAQQEEDSRKTKKDRLDSLYIEEVENKQSPDKVLHAEPLYIDLIRDLGARKGEKEWNVGLGLTDNNLYDSYEALIEYEWAPVNRLGLEVELPFTFYYAANGNGGAPQSRLNALKLAAQYTFLVSEKAKTSLAIGYLHEFEMIEFSNYGKADPFHGNLYSPFFVGAKRWGDNYHTLVYAGPMIDHQFSNGVVHVNWQINSNFHYMIPGTRNFLGVEFNKTIDHLGDFDMTIRPQMRVAVTDNLLIGIVTGIPVSRENERFSSFLRLIYEPPHKKH